MCSSIPPRMFQLDRPAGSGAANTVTPATVYASSPNPSLNDASNPAGGPPPTSAQPAAPAAPGAQLGASNPNQYYLNYINSLMGG